ncbi:hypothetical protein PO909_032510 [Leuciscus waleckii]
MSKEQFFFTNLPGTPIYKTHGCFVVGGAHCASARGAGQRTRGTQLFPAREGQNPHILGNHQKKSGRE